MLSGKGFLITGAAIACALWAACTVPSLLAEAPSINVEAQAIHYNLGDDPRWAGPDFDDSTWRVAQEGRWPEPAFYSDGFLWVRFRVPVRADTSEPLALRVGELSNGLIADEVFVDGRRVGSFGKVPPAPFVESVPRATVFDLPPGLTQPGAMAQVALRIWYPPIARRAGEFDSLSLTFDQSRTLHAEEITARQQALLSNVLPIALNVFILLVGFVVLLLAASSHSSDLLLYGAMIFCIPWITLFFEISEARLVTLAVPLHFLLLVITQIPAMIITIELVWKINDLKTNWFKRLAQALIALFNLGILIAFVPNQPSAMVSVARVVFPMSLQAFDVLTIAVYMWMIFVKRRKRPVAIALTLVPIASLVSGFRVSYHGGADLFDLAFFLAGFCLCGVLAHQAWKEWRTRDALQAEFETAREVQQRLVPPAVDVPGFHIESVYKPARHVGGDFFYICPEEQDGILVVVGDVSGKGLKAAMTVSSLIGALRTMPTLPVTRILAALNRGLAGDGQGGFVTCCAARITRDGEVAIANAGHLSPYMDGAEVPVSAGLPLGIDSCAEYEESRFLLELGSRLTFLSDGIVEARSLSGELFGFERTLQISDSGAEAIAQEAINFGQEDDITVLTLTRLAALDQVATHAPQIGLAADGVNI